VNVPGKPPSCARCRSITSVETAVVKRRLLFGGLRSRGVDLSVRVGSVSLPNPVMAASGTVGHGDELAGHLDLGALGAVTVKSLAAFAWPGNAAPRLHPTTAGMLNSVGLQGPGVAHWLHEELPTLVGCGARVVASIWGRTVDEYAQAAEALADAPASVLAVEVNLSCPNVSGHLFAHDARLTAEVMRATQGCGRPRWAKLSPNTAELTHVAGAAAEGGAEAVTLCNTLLGMVIDLHTRRPALGTGTGGGLSGAAIHPVAVRAVFDVRAAHRELPIVGVGGIWRGVDAVEMIMAGANAIQVGTATFADPRAPAQVLDELEAWCARNGVQRIEELSGAAQP
jgi:dihydroorotate dehydrogenase (NAD+) catalytic subunit